MTEANNMAQELPCSPVKAAPARPVPSCAKSEVNGLLVVDKPRGFTSFDVVYRIKKCLGLKKAGHCGTLDPFATGVLLICFNHATRIVDQLADQDKIYQCTIHLGVETDTLDRTGRVVRSHEGPAPAAEDLESALSRLQGEYLQQVPRYAAVKVQGRRLYKWSRSGIDVDLPERVIHIYSMELLAYRWPEVMLTVHCSKGTYIRQLASDIGQLLECGAHVSELRRLSSGPFRIDQAISLEELTNNRPDDAKDWRSKLVSMSDALVHLPAVVVEDEGTLRRLQDGHPDPVWEAEYREQFPERKDPVRIVTGDNNLAALWWPHPEAEQRRRLRVFQSSESTPL